MGEIFRTKDGNKWINATGNWSGGPLRAAMAVFKDYLYMSWGYRTKDGVNWEKINFNIDNIAHPRAKVESLEVFNGFLYAGIGFDSGNGIEVRRTMDGKTWDRFHEVLPPKLGYCPGHVHAMKAFDGWLYIGWYHGCALYRTDGSIQPSPSHWEEIFVLNSPGDVFRLELYENVLMVGLSFLVSQTAPVPLLCFSPDGIKWSIMSPGPVGGPNTKAITSLLSHEKTLLVGTFNPNEIGWLKLQEFGPEDALNDSKLKSAIKVGLKPTKTEISVTIDNLKLKGECYENLFLIKYKSTSIDECFMIGMDDADGRISNTKNDLVVSKFIGYPGSLSISPKEANGKALFVDIYNSSGILLKTFLTNEEVVLPCPTYIFNDKKLIVGIRGAKDSADYKLTVTYRNQYFQIYEFGIAAEWSKVFKVFHPEKKYFSYDQYLADRKKYDELSNSLPPIW